jgi:hypothetical protein
MSIKYPIFLCDETDRGQWTFWCPFCRKQHWHGAGSGHRGSHCWSPEGRAAMPEGYILRRKITHPADSEHAA